MPGPWQLCFDDGHQQRYLPDRQAVLRYVLAIGPQAASQRFEVFTDSGHTFTLFEVIDLGHPGETERLQAELCRLANEERESVRNGLPSRPESHTFDMGGGPFQRRTP